jgi:hypothetical protein
VMIKDIAQWRRLVYTTKDNLNDDENLRLLVEASIWLLVEASSCHVKSKSSIYLDKAGLFLWIQRYSRGDVANGTCQRN